MRSFPKHKTVRFSARGGSLVDSHRKLRRGLRSRVGSEMRSSQPKNQPEEMVSGRLKLDSCSRGDRSRADANGRFGDVL